jgi:hypothetical protein
MQNLNLFTFLVADHPSAVSGVVGRVVAIAPAPLLPGEKETDYADVALRIVRAARPSNAEPSRSGNPRFARLILLACHGATQEIRTHTS